MDGKGWEQTLRAFGLNPVRLANRKPKEIKTEQIGDSRSCSRQRALSDPSIGNNAKIRKGDASRFVDKKNKAPAPNVHDDGDRRDDCADMKSSVPNQEQQSGEAQKQGDRGCRDYSQYLEAVAVRLKGLIDNVLN